MLLMCSAGVLAGAPVGRTIRRSAPPAQPLVVPQGEVYRVKNLEAACNYLLEQAIACKKEIWLQLDEGVLSQEERDRLFFLLPSYRMAEMRVMVLDNIYKLEPRYKSCVRMLNYARGNKEVKLTAEEMRALQTAQKVLEGLEVQGKTSAETALALHDWIVLHSAYDAANANRKYPADHVGYNPFDGKYLLLEHKGVCDAYVQAYWLLLQLAGVPCSMVSGYVPAQGQGHAWMLVNMGDHWGHVDATFDDPMPDREGQVQHTYFDKTDKEMEQTHRWEQEMFPNAKGEGFMIREALHFDTLDDMVAYITQHPPGEYVVEVAEHRAAKEPQVVVLHAVQNALPDRRVSVVRDPFYPHALRLIVQLEAVDKPQGDRRLTVGE